MPGWAAIITAIIIGIITAISVITIASTGIAETDPRGAWLDPHCPAALPRGYQARSARRCFPNGGRAGTLSRQAFTASPAHPAGDREANSI
jgi:hypothetical protein